TGEFYKEYQSYKLKKGFREFNDLEEYAYILLRDNEEIRQEYHRHFNEILIDEYQDVNPLQEKILSLLTNGQNLFVVGDIKQSIYGFRFADPGIFKNRYNKYAKDEPNQYGLKILLNRNFRSDKGILDTVNYFFCQWMDENSLDLPYGEDEALISAGEDNEADTSPGVEMRFIYRPSDDEMNEFFDDPEEIRYHSRCIAKAIRDMIDSGETIREKGVSRPVQYGDVAIIIRSVKDTAPKIEEELTACGIPVTGPNKRHFTECQEVRLLLSLLRVLDNPRQDIPLASVLRSPFFGFDENEMMEVALSQPKKRLWCRLEDYLVSAPDSELKEKYHDFYEKISRWRNLAKVHPVADLLRILTAELNYSCFWSGLPGGKYRLRNVEIFQQKARDFQENGGGLFDFIRYVENLAKTGADEVDDGGKGENTVKIMSIHKSKGLEFPIVFCPCLEKKFNTRDSSYPLILHSELGLGPKYKNYQRRTISPTLPRLLIKHTINRTNTAERLRLLYVAMTRAEQRLIFTAAVSSQDKVEEMMLKARYCMGQKLPGDMMLRASSFMQWFCCGAARKDRRRLLAYQDCPLDISVIPAANPLEAFVGESSDIKLPPGALEHLAISMVKDDSVPVRGKVAVSDLLPQDQYISHDIASINPKFLQEAPSLNAVERGTVFHRFMELLDSNLPWNEPSLKGELTRMTEDGAFTESEAASVDLEAVAVFYNSSYGRELQEAETVKKELSFTVLLPAKDILAIETEEKTVVQGAVDMLYCRNNGTWVLIDYKTGNIGDRGDRDFLDHYGKQMELYALSLKQLYDIEISEGLFFLTQERRFLRYK
ncbi:MAG: UvrD-helicase domain-containing protein, partial [Bacillota bacterium]|nr:UvrD-helicase domain-containing protein [Bacillota bacterium]